MEIRRSKERIPAHGTEYRALLEHRREGNSTHFDSGFGELELQFLNKIKQERIAQSGEPLYERWMMAERRELGVSADDLLAWYRLLISELSTSPEHRRILRDIFAEELRVRVSPEVLSNPDSWSKEMTETICSLLSENPEAIQRIPVHTLKEMTQHHVGNFEQRKKSLESEILEAKQEVEKLLLAAIDKGILPIPLERAKRILEDIHIYVIDPVLVTRQFVGEYVQSDIHISYQMPVEGLRDILVHEYIHALSGKSLFKELNTDEHAEAISNGVDEHRVGLGFPNRRFNWLNEGITQMLAERVKTDVIYSSYQEEEDLFIFLCDFLRAQGVADPQKLFIDAFFEDYDLEKKKSKGTGIPAWKTLWQVLDEHFPNRVFVKLDKFIQQHPGGWREGVKEALAKYKEEKGFGFVEKGHDQKR